MPEGNFIGQVQLAPSIALESVRLFVTTKSLAGSDSHPQFWWYTDLQRNQPYYAPMYLERKQGGTDLFEQPFSPELLYDDFQQARLASFQIVVKGTSIWDINHFTMIGKFKQCGLMLHPQEVQGPPRTSWAWRDLGWRLMAFRDEDLVADPTVGVGGFVFTIVLNGTF